VELAGLAALSRQAPVGLVVAEETRTRCMQVAAGALEAMLALAVVVVTLTPALSQAREVVQVVEVEPLQAARTTTALEVVVALVCWGKALAALLHPQVSAETAAQAVLVALTVERPLAALALCGLAAIRGCLAEAVQLLLRRRPAPLFLLQPPAHPAQFVLFGPVQLAHSHPLTLAHHKEKSCLQKLKMVW